MKVDTISTASKQSLLALLQNSSLNTTLIQSVIALQSPHIPKTQLRISEFLKDVKNDELKQGKDGCVIGEPLRNDENKEQIEKFRQILQLLRQVVEKEDSEQRNLKRLSKHEKKFEWKTNIVEDSVYWNLIGVQIHDAPIVQKSIALFSMKNSHLKHIRFIGKIFGLESNYYVIETDHDLDTTINSNLSFSSQPRVYFGQTEQPAEESGARGTTNHYRYWVSTSGDSLSKGEWLRLPDVTPAQILTAKYIKKYFTGRLDAIVDSYPEFPGNEANYLRAQIARIVSATTIAPVNTFKLWTPPEEEEDEDTPKAPISPPISDLVRGKSEETDDEESSLNFKKFLDAENWVHLYPIILDVGRATQYKPPKAKTDDEEEEEEEAEDENKVPRLRQLSLDSGLKLPDYLKPLEKIKKAEDEDEEAEEEGEESSKKGTYSSWSFEAFGAFDEINAIVFAKSLRWPGAFAFAAENGNKTGTIYIGDGHKSEGDLNVFTPLIPEPIQQDVSEPIKLDDPSVTNEKRVRDFGEEPLKAESEEVGEEEE